MRIPTLSLQQPYATALVAGPKDIENRPRRIFRVPPGGMWVAIHSSRTHHGGREAESVRRLVRSIWPDLPPTFRLPLGATLGAVRFDADFAYPDYHVDNGLDEATNEAISANPWAFGPWCYRVAERRALTTPLPATGALGPWNVASDTGWGGFGDRVRAERVAALVALVPEWGEVAVA